MPSKRLARTLCFELGFVGSRLVGQDFKTLTLQDALSDPAVQAQILKVAQEKFPEAGYLEYVVIVRVRADLDYVGDEAASAAKDKVLEWANDPEVHHPSADTFHARVYCAGAEASICVCRTRS